MVDTLDIVLPISAMVSRYEKCIEQLREDRAAQPWYAWRRRAFADAAIATYKIEINILLEMSFRNQPIASRFILRDRLGESDRRSDVRTRFRPKK